MRHHILHFISIFFLLLLFAAPCGCGSDGDAPAPVPGKLSSFLCSPQNPAGFCESPDEICIEGACMPIQGEEDESLDEEREEEYDGDADVEDETPAGADDDADGEENKVFFPHLNIPKKFDPEVIKKGQIDPGVWNAHKFVGIQPNDDSDEEEVYDSSCDVSQVASSGQHDQCCDMDEFGFNYTDNASRPHYGICELQYDGDPISKKQYIYRTDKAKPTRHDILRKCVISMSCYEGILGTVISGSVIGNDISPKDVNIHIELYISDSLYEESEMGNVKNAGLILEDMGMPVDSDIIDHTVTYMDQYFSFMKDECQSSQ